MRTIVASTTIAFAGLFLLSCASLHSVQIGDIDLRESSGIPFEVKVSETGIDVKQATNIAKAVSKNKTVHQASNTVADVWAAITYGPRTGEVVFDDEYPDQLYTQVQASCPSTRIAGLASIRETMKYPVISGEIVRIRGFCK